MFKWFRNLNNFQKLVLVMISISVLFAAVLFGVIAFKAKLDSELNNPVVSLLNAQKDSSVDKEDSVGVDLLIDKTEASLEIGKTIQLAVTIEGSTENTKVSWDSSDEKVAVVDNTGLVTAKSVGTVTIRAKLSDRKTAISVIKVTEPPKTEPRNTTSGSGLASQNSYICPQGASDYMSAVKMGVLCLINKERVAMGLGVFLEDEKLARAASIRSSEISLSFSHTRPNNTDYSTVFQEVGFALGNKWFGENIRQESGLSGDSSVAAQTIYNNLIADKSNSDNIFKPEFGLMGLDVWESNSKLYIVQLFVQK